MGPGSLKAKLKGSMGQNWSMTYFGDYWTECHDSKAIWISCGPRCLLSLNHFPKGASKGPMWPKSSLASDICRRILDWFHRLWYITGLMETFNTRYLFTHNPDIICWLIYNLDNAGELVRPAGLLSLTWNMLIPSLHELRGCFFNLDTHHSFWLIS